MRVQKSWLQQAGDAENLNERVGAIPTYFKMNQLLKLSSAKSLSKSEQKQISGGAGAQYKWMWWSSCSGAFYENGVTCSRECTEGYCERVWVRVG